MRTSIKRFVSVVLVLSLALSMALTVSATEHEPLLSLNGPETVVHDSEFSLTLDCSAATVTDGKLTFSYDTNGLYFLSAEAGEAWPEAADLSLQVNDNGNGKLVLAFAGAVNAEAGTLVTLHFETREVLGEASVELDGTNSYLTGVDAELTASATVDRVCHAAQFPDVNPVGWYHDGLDYVVDKGYMIGMPGGVFAPEAETTRTMLVLVLHRMAGEPEVEGDLPFTDVRKGCYYYDAVAWAYSNGITTGATATTFEPDENVTREQLAVFFRRFAEYKGMDVSTEGSLDGFVDAKAVTGYAVESMKWAVENGIIQGMPGKLLAPKDDSNRVQIATMMVRFDALLEN